MNPFISNIHTTHNAAVEPTETGGTRLSIPHGNRTHYRLAQIDDYINLHRADFSWRPPLRLSLAARISSPEVEGTWGFGFWNAPMRFTLGLGGNSFLPALPDAAWFFFASPANYLSFKDDQPAHGFMAQAFRSVRMPIWPFFPLAIGLPLLLFRPIARLVRKMVSRYLVQESSHALSSIDPCEFHNYSLDWEPGSVRFSVDDQMVHETDIAPHAPMGLVIWIDNQFAAFRPDGMLGMGLLASDRSEWLEISDIAINNQRIEYFHA